MWRNRHTRGVESAVSGGSNPLIRIYVGVAQLAERERAMLEVASSILVAHFFEDCRSGATGRRDGLKIHFIEGSTPFFGIDGALGEGLCRLSFKQEIAGSNPARPI